MTKKIAELKVDTSEDYFDKVVKTLENAGFLVVLDTETSLGTYYIVATSDIRKIIVESENKND